MSIQATNIKTTRFSNRQRATLAALAAMFAVPFAISHGHLTFQPYIAQSGWTRVIATAALTSVYYVLARALLDLCEDCIDFFKGNYVVAGDGKFDIDQRRRMAPPYDLLSVPGLRRDFSDWQYALIVWLFFDILISWISTAAVIYVELKSPYLKSCISEEPLQAVLWCTWGMSLFLVVFAQFSIAYRWTVGITPLVQRFLGLPNTYPGQNIFPRWFSELLIKVIKRPM